MGDLQKMPHSFLVRKKLCHDIPAWVGSGSRHFVTINCRHRGCSALTIPSVAQALLKSLQFYENQGHWYPWLAVVMPDHLHVIVTFNLSIGIRRTIAAWKRFHARSQGIEWQSDFFEHRLRNDAEFIAKSAYVRQNPVRKQLVNKVDEWPFLWEREKAGDGGGPA
jgi:putative transposase